MEFPSLEQLRTRNTRKWTVYEPDVLPLWVAESDFSTAPAVKKRLAELVENETFGYTPGSSGLPQALSDFYDRRYGFRPDPDKVVSVADVVRGLLLGINYFTREDSAVIVPVPAYPPFLALPETAGRQKIEIDSRNGLDLNEVEDAFRNGAGSILLAAPNNPMGFNYSEAFLRELIELAHRYDARVLVDEIHAPLVYSGRHVVAAGLGDHAAEVCFTVTATSKAWNIAGLKCAQIIFTNDDDLAIWNSLTGVAKDGVGTLGVFAAETCYSDTSSFLDDQVDYLRDTFEYLSAQLPQAIEGIQFPTNEATYLLWLDFSETALGDLEEPAGWLRREAKVALNEGVTFGTYGEHHARLNFATSREILDEAIDRMATAIKRR